MRDSCVTVYELKLEEFDYQFNDQEAKKVYEQSELKVYYDKDVDLYALVLNDEDVHIYGFDYDEVEEHLLEFKDEYIK